LWFYLLAPWLVRQRTWVLVGLAAVSLGIQLGLKQAGYLPGVFAPAQVCFFLAGMLGYRLGKRWAWWSQPAVGWAVFGLIVVGVFAAPWCASGVYHAGLYAGLAAGAYPLFKLTANWKWDRWVGELSYPLYLVHMAVLWAVKWTAARWGMEWSSGVVLAISLGLAVVLYLLVDRPFDLFRRRFAERPREPRKGEPKK
jgi:peptidoglycan/LPS O-acetylase OafA/YrhL